MKASASPRTWIVSLLAVVACGSFAFAQDVVVQKNGVRSEGQILGVAAGKIKIKVGPVETTIPLDQAATVTKEAPKSYTDGLAAWDAGNAAQALPLIKSTVDTFQGLPTPWAERASALLGDVYLTVNQVPAAETAFAEFQKAYPGSTAQSDIGLARLAVEKKDFATARAKLEPIVAEAQGVTLAPEGKGAMYGQAFFLMGVIQESEGNLPEALRDYLSTVTLFYEDQAVVAKARERADILVKEKQVIVP